jgi:phosphoenolpyruvate-protein phosphotransferase
MEILSGVPAARGFAAGPVYVIHPHRLRAPGHKTAGSPSEEWTRYMGAVVEAKIRCSLYYEKALAEAGADAAAIFEAHAAMLEDPDLQDAIQEAIEKRYLTAEAAVEEATEFYTGLLAKMDNEYFRQRADDVRAIGSELAEILSGSLAPPIELTNPSIILAEDFTPAQTVQLDKSLVLGFCLARGGVTSHTSILARSLGLPAVVGTGMAILSVKVGSHALLNGCEGTLYIGPDADTQVVFEERAKAFRALQQDRKAQCHLPTFTRDGRRVEVAANIGSIAAAQEAIQYGAEGAGLLRTEFLYLEKTSLPTEEEQYQAYQTIADVFHPHPVVLRTLDIGGDKELPYLTLPSELNPFLGVRALRLCLQQPELFIPQLRAALRTGAGRSLKIMFPMVADLDELRQARQLLENCRGDLQNEGTPVADKLEIGIMVEIPSAALLADWFAGEVDFFSIGTNDLTQYTLAVDRTNASLDYLSSSLHPAVLHLIEHVTRAAHTYGIWVGVCGEMAADPLAVPILLGLGLDEFSMSASAIPDIKDIIRRLTYTDAKGLAVEALRQPGANEVMRLVLDRLPWLADFE